MPTVRPLMAPPLQLILILIFLISITASGEEEFTEELLLRPLPDRKVLSHFHFHTTVPSTDSYGRHHHLFPKAIYQLVQKFRVREMELSFTQGRWNYKRWGGCDPIASKNAKPPGVELWAVFDVPQDQVDVTWKNLTHALSGLFCASINFLESSTTYSTPNWSFPPFSHNLRYGTLPREAVCTENLTPWLKLLPCRDKSGIASLMDRPSIYRGFYHSQRLHLISNEFGMVLEQTLTVVLQPTMVSGFGSAFQPSWSISSLFDRNLGGKCVLSKSSNVYIHIEGSLVSHVRNIHGAETLESMWSNPIFKLSVPPQKVIKEIENVEPSILFGYSIEKYNEFELFDLEFKWNSPLVWLCPQAPLHATRFLMGSGNERGAVAISLESTGFSKSLQSADSTEDVCRLRVNIFQVVPWYVKVYYHTIQVFVDEQPQSLVNVIEKMHVSPSEDKVMPGLMEILLRLPCDVKLATLTLEFDKGFLHIDEYPPDANQGFDIPSAMISFSDFRASMNFLEDHSSNKSPVISKLRERSSIQFYTEVLLVPLTTPDFSMPYNVVTITCTVFALYFGSLLNALRRRVGEEERLLKSRAAKKAGKFSSVLLKLLAKLRGRQYQSASQSVTSSSSSSSFFRSKLFVKIIVVAGVAAGWQYYIS